MKLISSFIKAETSAKEISDVNEGIVKDVKRMFAGKTAKDRARQEMENELNKRNSIKEGTDTHSWGPKGTATHSWGPLDEGVADKIKSFAKGILSPKKKPEVPDSEKWWLRQPETEKEEIPEFEARIKKMNLDDLKAETYLMRCSFDPGEPSHRTGIYKDREKYNIAKKLLTYKTTTFASKKPALPVKVAYTGLPIRQKMGEDFRHNFNLKEAITYTDIDDWKQAVKNSYPQQAKRISFLSRMEGNKMTVSAEIKGEERCYGVWDMEDDEGVVLSEAATWSKTRKTGKHDETGEPTFEWQELDSNGKATGNCEWRNAAGKCMDRKKLKEAGLKGSVSSLMDKAAFKKAELDQELSDEDTKANTKMKFGIEIEDKLWKKDGKAVSFPSKVAATKAALSGSLAFKKTTVVPL